MATLAIRKWTVMVYLAGDNNLDSAGVVDLKEMKEVGSTDQVAVIAQFDRSGKTRATKRYALKKGGTLAKDEVQSLGETDMGDPRVLQSFLEWGIQKYPAQHFLVVLWNHGAGWDDEDIYRAARRTAKLAITRRHHALGTSGGRARAVSIRQLRVVGTNRFRRALFATTIHAAVEPGLRARAIAFDDASKDFLDNLETKKVFAAIRKKLKRKVDILGMDACLMSMAEVGFQVRDSVAFTVGSEEVEPSDGWPYHKVLARLAKKPGMTPKELARTIAAEYVASYGANEDVTQSACDLGKCDLLGGAIDDLGKALKSHLDDAGVRAAVIQSRVQVQSYDVPDYVDLYNFCELVDTSCDESEVREACHGVMSALDEGGYVVESGFKGAKVEHSNGCSIYFPQKTISPLYATLDFTRRTAWDEFLAEYLSHTRQRTRTPDRGITHARPVALAARKPR